MLSLLKDRSGGTGICRRIITLRFFGSFTVLEICECSHLQDYQVHNLLGRGGFANVYRAKSLVTGQEVAIKMVSIHFI